MIKFRKRKLRFKVPDRSGVMFGLFLAMVLFIPFTKISVPAIHLYELTLGDCILIVLSFLTVYFNLGMRKSFMPFYILLILFTFVSFCSIVMVRDWLNFLLSLMPFGFSLLISYVTLSYFSTGNLKNRMRVIRNLLVFSLFLSAIPVYMQFIAGFKNILFYDPFGWRYTFLSQNPNQFGVYFILFFFMITLITVKFFPKTLGKVVLFEAFFFIPALFSGSRSTTLVFTLNFLLLLGFYFVNTSHAKRFSIASIAFVFVSVIFQPAMNYIKTQAGQLRRALSIFEKVQDGADFEIGGAIQHSIEDAMILYYQYPILGVGLGNKPAYSGVKTEVHNTFILYLSETGTLGFILFMLMFLITPLYAIFSRANFKFIMLVLVIFVLFAAQNVPAMLFRQRWVWLFLCISFVLVNVDKEGNYQTSKIQLFN